MTHSPMQSGGLVTTLDTFEDGATATADPSEKARPDRIPELGDLSCTVRHAWLADARFRCV